jgi:DUF4097 and DUF4098 domain-containing protein YvlB
MRRLLALSVTLLLSTAAFAADDTIRKGFQVADGGTLRLDAGVGNVKIVTGGSGVAFEVTRNGSKKRLQGHEITFRQSGNDVIVESEMESDHGFFGGFDDYEVQWNIRVPARYNVEAQTSGGDIELEDMGGTVDVRTSGGSITTGRLGGKATLKTSGGSIRVDGATAEVTAHTSGGGIEIGDTTGEVDARTSGGSIKLARVGGSVVAKTSGGSIRIDDASGSVDAHTSGGSITARLSKPLTGDSRLSTSGGGVTVSLAPGIGVELDARSSGGGVHTDIPITVQGKLDDDSVQGRIGNGGPKLTLRASGGGIRVTSL